MVERSNVKVTGGRERRDARYDTALLIRDDLERRHARGRPRSPKC